VSTPAPPIASWRRLDPEAEAVSDTVAPTVGAETELHSDRAGRYTDRAGRCTDRAGRCTDGAGRYDDQAGRYTDEAERYEAEQRCGDETDGDDEAVCHGDEADGGVAGRYDDEAGRCGVVAELYGDTAGLHDRLTGRAGAFARLGAVIARLRAGDRPPALACEVPVCPENLDALPRIVDLAHSLGALRCTFAAPTVDATAMAPVDVVIPAVLAALARCRELGVEGRVRGLPACLLGEEADSLEATRDASDPPAFACLFASRCELFERCAGLPTAYVHRFGWEARRLRPALRASPWPRRDGSPEAFAAWRALLGPAARRVTAVALDRCAARIGVDLGRGRSLVLELTPRTKDGPALARSRSFDIRYTQAKGIGGPGLARIVTTIAAAIVARDDGSLDLDPRRGLPPLPLPTVE